MIRLLAALWVFLGACLLPSFGQAADFCDMDTALASYKAAFNREKRGDVEGAHKTFLTLAQAGVAPAQRHVALYYLEEAREDMALENAIMWAQLAAWGGDSAAAQVVKRAVEAARHQVAEIGLNWAKDWRPQKPNCNVSVQDDKDDDDFQVVGRFPLIRHESVDEDTFAAFATRLAQALDVVGDVAPYFSPLAEMIPAFEVVQGKGSDRYIQWDGENDWVQISTGFLEDQSVRQLAYSLVLAAQRRLFDQINDAEFADQISTHYGKIKIFGSLYGDVKTTDFLSLMSEAIKEARNLPTVLRDKVNFLDEIYYMPPSRYHHSRLPSSKFFATYDHVRSRPERRIMVVSHKVGFETVPQMILELVRVGELAQQHVRIEALRGQVDGKKREDAILKALQGNMKDVTEAFTQNNADQKKQMDDWDRLGPDGVKKVYCESVYAQVKAAISLKMEPTHFSQRVKTRDCAKARDAWQAYRSGETKK